MFKTKEELFKKKYPDMPNNVYITHEEKWDRKEFADGLNVAFKSFAERVEFYKKYENDYAHFKSDNKSVKIPRYVYTHSLNLNFFMYWHAWLFDYCFGDVI